MELVSEFRSVTGQNKTIGNYQTKKIKAIFPDTILNNRSTSKTIKKLQKYQFCRDVLSKVNLQLSIC